MKNYDNMNNNQNDDNDDKLFKKLLIVGIILALVIGGITIYYKIQDNQKNKETIEKDTKTYESIKEDCESWVSEYNRIKDRYGDRNVSLGSLREAANMYVDIASCRMDITYIRTPKIKKKAIKLFNKTMEELGIPEEKYTEDD